MVKKCIKTVLFILNKMNKRTFIFVFFAVIFSFFVSFQDSILFQNAEEMKISVQVAEAEDEGEDECVPSCGSCSCCYCNYPPCCDCTCAGDSVQWPPPGYEENRDCHKTVNCSCCSCTATCTWGPWYDVEWCGDETVNDTEDCDAGSTSSRTCDVYNPKITVPPDLLNDGFDNTSRFYDGLYLCNRCNWQYFDVDGGADDSQICYADTNCPESEALLDCTPGGIDQWCDWAGFIGSYDCSVVAGNDACKWDDNIGLDCTPIDWCGDGKVNGQELYCDIHKNTGTVDFVTGFQTCAEKVCKDIDPDDLEDRSSYSKRPYADCIAQNFDYNPKFIDPMFPGGQLTCANTCRHIYTVPACNLPLNATGLDLSDDGQHVFVTDSSLWSLQMFPVSTPPLTFSEANPEKLIAIYYLDAEPLSVDVVGSIGVPGSYAYIGTKGDPVAGTLGEFIVVDINQLNRADDYPDPAPQYSAPPFMPKDPFLNPPVPLLPFQEEQPPEMRAIPEMVKMVIPPLGEVNDVHVVGNYAYLAIGTEGAVGSAAFEIIDISAPLAPVSVGSYSYPNTTTGVQSVDVSGNYAYVSYTDGINGVGYFDYFDISGANPTKMLTTEIDISSSTSSIDVFGNYAFIDGFSTFNSIDITDPANPYIDPTVHAIDNLNLGHSKPLPNETFAMDINDLGNISYVSTENIGLRAVNISNPENISESIVLTAPNNAPVIVDVVIDSANAGAGEYAYAAGLGAGLLVFNLGHDCGDGVLNGFEICDGGDLGGKTCAHFGFTGGDLSCGRFCNAFDTSACIITVSPACEGVVCDDPGPFCEIGPGVCEYVPDVSNVGVCVYPDDPNACITPGFCQVGPGECDKSNGDCYYPDDPNLCDYEGSIGLPSDVCTGDRCVSLDGGLSSNCMAGSNICGGLVPCGRMVNDPNTAWDDTASCEFCHGIMLLNQGMNFMLGIASVVAILALVITGFLFITSTGNPERRNSAKTTFKWIIIGFLILFLSWLIVDFILSAWGYLDPLGGEWNVVCE